MKNGLGKKKLLKISWSWKFFGCKRKGDSELFKIAASSSAQVPVKIKEVALCSII
jgi:hypothetical protein